MVNKRSLKYEKQDGVYDEHPAHVGQEWAPSVTSKPIPSILSIEGYSKADGLLSYNLICVISGGTDRERAFLNEVERKHTFRNLEVVFVSSEDGKGGLTPNMMQGEYNSICQDGLLLINGRHIQIDAVDEIYLFTDVDHYYDELQTIICSNSSNAKWMISNPCFEIWLYYCYKNDPQNDLQEVIEIMPSKRSIKLKEVNGRFNNGGGLDPRMAFEHLDDGIIHSKGHYSEDRNGIPTILSTNLFEFAENVISKLGMEYEEWRLSKQAWRERMKKSSE